MVEYRTCNKCNETKELNKDNFIWRNNRQCWDSFTCKDCYSKYQKKYRQKNNINIKMQRKEYRENNKEKISKQRKISNKKNKEKISLRHKLWREKNPEKVKKLYKKHKSAANQARRKKYNENNQYRIKILNRNSEYYEKNKSQLISKNNIRSKKRRNTDPTFKLRANVSRAINHCLKKNGTSKNGRSILQFLPYTVDELKIWLQKHWKPWMNWDNYGPASKNKRSWHIDHVIPQSLLPYNSMEDENFKKCWALKNLRPMEAIANIRKSNKIAA